MVFYAGNSEPIHLEKRQKADYQQFYARLRYKLRVSATQAQKIFQIFRGTTLAFLWYTVFRHTDHVDPT